MDGESDYFRDWLILLHAPGVGPAGAQALLQAFGTPTALLQARPESWQRAGLSAETCQWLANPGEETVARDLGWLSEPDHHFLPISDRRYPARLRQTGGAPLGLFVVGDPDVLVTAQLAVVGSRNPTPAGTDNARAFAETLARSGLTITSGLALGIDAAAHRGALDADGFSVAVCGTGLDRVYPARHRDLARRIAAQGALVSEFPPGTPPLAENFPRRNRIISGLSLGVLVVEAARESGSLITARLATSQGREVFAIPGSIHNPLSRGCHRLIREGAKLVEEARDVLEEIGPLLSDVPEPLHSCTGDTAEVIADGSGLDADYGEILAVLGHEPARVDQLVERSGLAADAVASMLLILELRGAVQQVQGGSYMRRP